MIIFSPPETQGIVSVSREVTPKMTSRRHNRGREEEMVSFHPTIWLLFHLIISGMFTYLKIFWCVVLRLCLPRIRHSYTCTFDGEMERDIYLWWRETTCVPFMNFINLQSLMAATTEPSKNGSTFSYKANFGTSGVAIQWKWLWHRFVRPYTYRISFYNIINDCDKVSIYLL